jgi:hypothetical protein
MNWKCRRTFRNMPPPFSCLIRSVHTREKAHNVSSGVSLLSQYCSIAFTCTPFLPQEVIKRLRFDIPVGLESIPADWGKVVSYAEYSLTQRRSKIKKAVSLNSHSTVQLSAINGS